METSAGDSAVALRDTIWCQAARISQVLAAAKRRGSSLSGTFVMSSGLGGGWVLCRTRQTRPLSLSRPGWSRATSLCEMMRLYQSVI